MSIQKFDMYGSIPKDFTGVAYITAWNMVVRCKNGKHHCEDGPAKQSIPKNEYSFCVNGKYHRIGGPAKKYKDYIEREHVEYFINGKEYTVADYWNHPENIKLKLNEILSC